MRFYVYMKFKFVGVKNSSFFAPNAKFGTDFNAVRSQHEPKFVILPTMTHIF